MEIKQIKISELIPAEYNPRQMTEKQAKDLEKSIKKFGLVDPIIVNSHPDRCNIVIGGHQRLKIAQKLGFDEVPVYFIELDEEMERELNIRLNKNSGEWDLDLLANFDKDFLIDVGFGDKELSNIFGLGDNMYAKKIVPPVYKPSAIIPNISELYESNTCNEFIDRIDKMQIDQELKEFLKYSAYRLVGFNYDKIADYYSNADKEVQNIMEDLALVVIDFNKAIENNYVLATNNLLGAIDYEE